MTGEFRNGNVWKITTGNVVQVVAVGVALFLGLQPHIMGERSQAQEIGRISEGVQEIRRWMARHDAKPWHDAAGLTMTSHTEQLEQLQEQLHKHVGDASRHETDREKRQRIREVIEHEYGLTRRRAP